MGSGRRRADRCRGARHALAPRLVAVDRLGLASVRRRRRGGHVGRKLLLAGHRVQHHARVLREMRRDDALHVVGRDPAIALEVLVQITRVAGVLVVVVEPVRAPAASRRRARGRGTDRARTRCARDRPPPASARRARAASSSASIAASSSAGVWPGRASAWISKIDVERARRLAGVDVLRELLVVDERLVEAARLAAAEDLRRDVELRVARRERRRREPREVDARQLDAGR